MNDSHSSRRKLLLTVVALLLVSGAAAWVFDRKANAAAKPAATPSAVQATTAKVLEQDVPIYRIGIGTVTANASVTVKARIDGQLDKVGFAEGQDVKAGQMLARIDPRTVQAQLAQAQATQAKDAAQLGNARVDLQRYIRLVAEDAATQQQLDTQKALVAQLEAAVQTDQAAVDYARVQLSFTHIVAPISGRVGARLVDPGNIVHAADTTGLVVINQIDPISVVFTLPGEAFQDINRALKASREPLVVEAWSRDGSQRIGSGRLALLNNQIDTTTGTVQLKGLFANPAHALWPGQFVNARLLLGQRDKALTVPAPAVQRGPEGTYAFVVGDDSKVRNQPIKVAEVQDGLAVIDQGLESGQRVVVDGQYKLKPGSKIVEGGSAGGKAASAASGASAVASGAGS